MDNTHEARAMRLDLASGTQTMQTQPCVAGERRDCDRSHVSFALRALRSRLASYPEVPAQPEPRRLTALERFIAQLPPRHRDATLDNFVPPNREAEAALRQLREYCAQIRDHVARGHGIVLYGPSGTGKDHLLIGAARYAVAASYRVRRIVGAELFRSLREAMHDGQESRVIDALKHPDVLLLSDPLPAIGGLTPHQSACLYEVIDHRWQHRQPTWCSINVASAREADERLGAAIVDRLQHDSLVLRCAWTTRRRPMTTG